MHDTELFLLFGSSPHDFCFEADGLEDLLAGIAWALDRGHLQLNPTIEAASKQIRMRMEFLRQRARDIARPISGAVS